MSAGGSSSSSFAHATAERPLPPHGAGGETFAHGADVGIRGFGPSPAAAFAEAALALTSVVVDPTTVQATTVVPVEVDGGGLEDLFYAWIDAVVFSMATRRMLFSSFAVAIDDMRLHATLRGEAVDRTRHATSVEVKAPTFDALTVRRDAAGRWVAQCVVDV
jgi:SHS2 domain-containing protein